MDINHLELTRAREARAAIERLYIEMRHLFNSGEYRRPGTAGEVLTEALLTLSPEIYGSMGDPNKVELAGLVYVMDRLPRGIEECSRIQLISGEGYADSEFDVIIPAKRRRNCYRIDEDQMFIEVTRGRSEIYDILTHLTFMFMEAEKIKAHVLDEEGELSYEWLKLGKIIEGEAEIDENNQEVAITYLSTILGRTFEETLSAYKTLERNAYDNNGLFQIVYHLGRIAIEEEIDGRERRISFSPTLRERIGHHIYGERWASQIKQFLFEKQLFDRPLHIISANLHSVMNSFFAYPALKKRFGRKVKIEELAMQLSQPENGNYRRSVQEYAQSHGMYTLDDPTGTNISVQIFDTAQLDWEDVS
ncbi:MAG: hypothetical protein AAF206_27735, partial [Bacteroidota bacterium]